ncbi:MAG: glycosyltransferase family 2 protein [Propionibacteriaceae bacterium]
MSICIPAFEAERHLGTTLTSVLAQGGDDLEILVLDNASTDATAVLCAAAAAADPRVRIERNPTVLPLPENWNRAIELSRGELIKVVCADDLIHPDAVQVQANALRSNPDIALVASRRHLIDDDGGLLAADQGLRHLTGTLPGRTVAARVVRSGGNPLGEPGGAMFRRRDFERAGGFDGSLLFPMDLDLWMKLLKFGDFLGQRETLAAFRAAANSLSSARSLEQFREQRILTGRITRDTDWRLGRLDTVLGTVGARWARTRRELLFRASGWSGRRALEWVNARHDVGWLHNRAVTRPAAERRC